MAFVHLGVRVGTSECTSSEWPVARRPRRCSRHVTQQRASLDTGEQIQAPTAVDFVQQFAGALELYFRTVQVNELEQLVDANCVWTSPLGTFKGREEILEFLRGNLEFFVNPSLAAVETCSRSSTFHWVASGRWPFPHRPRVVVAGRTSLTVSGGKAIKILDEWYQRPRDAFLQTLPRVEDIFWAYGAPHAEVNDGLRRTVSKTDDYVILEESAHEAVEAVLDPVAEEMLDVDLYYAVPRPPEEAYTGEVRRLELYATVSPTCVRQREDGNVVWSVMYPTAYWSGQRSPHAESGVKFLSIPRRTLAVRTLYGKLDLPDIQAETKALEESLRRDGLLSGKPHPDSILYYHYASRHGFDSRGALTISSFAAVPFKPARNEVAIVLDGGRLETPNSEV